MIAITTYTDPFAAAAAVNEIPKPLYDPIEDREDTEGASFEEILAGIMQNREQSPETPEEVHEEVNFVEGISTENVLSNIKFDIHALLEDNNKQNIEFEGGFDLANIGIHEVDLSNLDLDSGELPEIDFSSGEILQELQAFSSDFISHSIEQDQDVQLDKQNLSLERNNLEFAGTKNNESAAQAEQQIDIASHMTDNNEAVQQVLASLDAVKAQAEDETSLNKRGNFKPDNITISETRNLFSESPAEKTSAERQSEKAGRLDETRSRSRRDRVTFDVRDMRTEKDTVDGTQARTYTTVEAAAARVTSDVSTQELTLDLRLPDYNNGQSAQVSWEVKSGAALENMLARELHQNFNGDIVRHASIALRDGGESTIKLNLHPESLGNVKIRLEMSENKITGHIIVESKEALNAFRDQIADLEQAFRESGFADASLNLSLTADGSGAQQHGADILASQQIASIYEGSLRDSTEIETVQVDVYFGGSQGKVNMLA